MIKHVFLFFLLCSFLGLKANKVFMVDSNIYNWPPEIRSLKYDYVITERDEIVIDIYGKDTLHPSDTLNTKLDTVRMSWNYGIPQGEFTVINPRSRNKHAQFVWETKLGDAQLTPYTFTVTAKDEGFPLLGTTIKGYSILVKPLYPVGVMDRRTIDFSIYPNPAKDYAKVKLPQSSSIYTVRILSIDGKVLYEERIGEKREFLELNVEAFIPGIYFLEVKTIEGIYRSKVVKE